MTPEETRDLLEVLIVQARHHLDQLRLCAVLTETHQIVRKTQEIVDLFAEELETLRRSQTAETHAVALKK